MLQGKEALRVDSDKSIVPGKRFSEYAAELDRIESVVAKTREDKRQPGDTILAKDVMTDSDSFIFAPGYETVLSASRRMLDGDVQALPIPGESGRYRLITKVEAASAYSENLDSVNCQP